MGLLFNQSLGKLALGGLVAGGMACGLYDATNKYGHNRENSLKTYYLQGFVFSFSPPSQSASWVGAFHPSFQGYPAYSQAVLVRQCV